MVGFENLGGYRVIFRGFMTSMINPTTVYGIVSSITKFHLAIHPHPPSVSSLPAGSWKEAVVNLKHECGLAGGHMDAIWTVLDALSP